MRAAAPDLRCPAPAPTRPAEALLAGLLVLCMALGCLPLVQQYYPQSQGAKRALLLATVLAALLALLRPPLPLPGGSECPDLPFGLCPRLWDEGHAPDQEEDDVSVWGEWALGRLMGCGQASWVGRGTCRGLALSAPRRLALPIAGDGLRRRTHWPLWLMLGAAFFGLSAMTQPGGGGALGALLKAGQAGGSAALVAAYLALEFFPGLPLVQVRGPILRGR